ncbi:MAG: preprotein translocase subunit SecE [Bacteroidota bacterium]
MITQTKGYFDDVAKEMKKVSWPTREQLKESTGVVLITCFIITLFTYAVDTVMTLIMSFLF